MGEVEVSINEEGALKVSQRHDLGALLPRLRPQGFGRRCVVDESNRSGDIEEAEFIWRLKLFFTATLILTAINFIIFESIVTHTVRPPWNYVFNYIWLFGHFLNGPTGIVVLFMFAVLLTVGVLAKNVTRGGILAWLRSGQAPTMSATIQHI